MRRLYRRLGELESRVDALRNVDFSVVVNSIRKIFKHSNLVSIQPDGIINEFLYRNPDYILVESEDIENSLLYIKICTIAYLKTVIHDELNLFIRNSDKYVICSHCSTMALREGSEYTEIRGSGLACPSCIERHYSICDDCGVLYRTDRMYSIGRDGDHLVCPDCADSDNYITCNNCGYMFFSDDTVYCDGCGEYYCQDHVCNCYRTKIIHGYSYKPRPKFYGKGKRFLGLELEIDNLDDVYDFASELNEAVPLDLIYMKTDGSLSSDGIEIVSHPCTIEYLKSNFPFDKVHDIAIKYNGTSHSAGNCGLHVHVSNKYFSHYELGVTKILYFFERFWKQLAKLSRRNNFHYCQRNEKPYLTAEYVDKVKYEATKNGRYTAVNLCNSNTIEFRLWRGTLNVNTIIATLELTDLICVVCETTSIMTLQKMTWEDFKQKAVEFKYKSLTKYFTQINI